MKQPHKIMTLEEYELLDLQGWHEVCRNHDGFGGVAIRYKSDAPARRCECGVWQADKYCGACGGFIDRGTE